MLVPQALRKAFEGRHLVTLGVPPSAHVGDVVATLLVLYPQLVRHLADDRNPANPGLQFFLGERSSFELAHRGTGLREGSRLYLFALVPRRLAAKPG